MSSITGFRRTLVGLKYVVKPVGVPAEFEFQTNPRGVEVCSAEAEVDVLWVSDEPSWG